MEDRGQRQSSLKLATDDLCQQVFDLESICCGLKGDEGEELEVSGKVVVQKPTAESASFWHVRVD